MVFALIADALLAHAHNPSLCSDRPEGLIRKPPLLVAALLSGPILWPWSFLVSGSFYYSVLYPLFSTTVRFGSHLCFGLPDPSHDGHQQQLITVHIKLGSANHLRVGSHCVFLSVYRSILKKIKKYPRRIPWWNCSAPVMDNKADVSFGYHEWKKDVLYIGGGTQAC